MKIWQFFLLIFLILFILTFWPVNFWFLPDLSIFLILLLAIFWLKMDSPIFLLLGFFLLVIFSYSSLFFLAADILLPLLVFIFFRAFLGTSFSLLTIAAFFSFLIRFFIGTLFLYKNLGREGSLYLACLNFLSFSLLLLSVVLFSKLRKTKTPRLKTL